MYFGISHKFFLSGLQFWTNMKPYSNQIYGPTYLPYTIGVSGKNNFVDQKTSVYKVWPGHHTTIHVLPKLLDTTSDYNNLDLNTRNCKLPHETDGFQLLQEYSQTGCELECASKKAMSFCKCLPWQYPNNFTSYPICDMFGGFCFNTIVSDIVYHKNCKSECYEDCKETSFATWHSTVPLDAEDLCKYNTFFDRFMKQNFQRLFAFESYQMLLNGEEPSQLAASLSNGTLCMNYIRKYVSFISVESPTKSVTKSHRDQSSFFIDKLGIIGGNLAIWTGMSVLSMVEVVVFFYIVIIGIALDVIGLWKKVLSLFGLAAPKNNPKHSPNDMENNQIDIVEKSWNELNHDFEEEQQLMQKQYVSKSI